MNLSLLVWHSGTIGTDCSIIFFKKIKASHMIAQRTQVQKFKYDGTLWGMYEVFGLHQSPDRLAFWQPRGTFIQRNEGWVMRHDHIQFFYPNRWYAISASYGNDGRLHHCYCDIVLKWQPPAAESPILHFIDLELDLHAEPSRGYRICDEDEFAAAVRLMRYPDAVRDNAQAALDALVDSVRAWDDPFSHIPLVLPRNDLHFLDTTAAAWQGALTALGME